jgi:integrase
MIHVRRTWTCGQVGLPKSKASKGPVPLHPLLADFMRLWKQKTTYFQAGDWVFPSTRLDGKQPRVANMLVEDHLRPAAVKAGILSSHPDNHGGLVDDDPRRFGFHNLRHSLASFLIRIRTDPKTVQTLLRHSDVKLTLQFYTHAVSRDRMVAAGKMLTAILSHAPNRSWTESGLNWKTVQGKFFKDMDLGADLVAPPSRCGLRADWNTMTRVTQVL